MTKIKGMVDSGNLNEISSKIAKLQKEVGAMDMATINADLDMLKEYVDAFDKTLKSTKDTDELIDNATQQVEAAINGMDKMSDGLGSLKDGLIAMRDGGETPDGRTSAGLSGALKALGSANEPKTLIGGAATLQGGLGSLNKGLTSASDGADKLAKGTGELSKAAPKLYKGITQLDDGASQLAKGSKSAAEGGEKLAEGLKEFNDEAIQKLLDAYDENIAGLTDRISAVVEMGKDYQNFSGIAKGTKGTVKFIYETDAISAE